MPIVVSQPVAQTPVTDAQSPDGKIRATVLTGTAGVFIRVDYTSMLGQLGYTWPNPFRVTIWRQLPGGEPEPVRGAENISQYGAIFHAYDDEVTFGQQVVYWAEAPTRDGGEIVETDKVVVLTWEPDGGFTQPGVWIKNLENPDLSVPARCVDWSAGSWASRNATADVWGASAPAVTTDVRKSYNTKMIVLTKDEDEYQALLAAIDASVVYVVGLERHRRRTGYYLVGDIAPTRLGRASSSYDSWDIGLTGMGRPKSAGHSLTVPGKTYADRRRAFETYQNVLDYGDAFTMNLNPTFDVDTADWTAYSAALTRSNAQSWAGGWSGLITSTAASDPRAEAGARPVVAGRSYRATGRLYAAQALGGGAGININWFKADGSYLTTSANSRVPVVGTWEFYDKAFVAPPGAASGNVVFSMGGTPGAGKLLYGDSIRMLPVRHYGAGTEPY
ncbi:hypothetical protein SEA_MICRODON_25 [Streptomyces phage Microdon]|nr:hypothetical protein SEA_MICRODON_25 [Streptomyces phage Microdon]